MRGIITCKEATTELEKLRNLEREFLSHFDIAMNEEKGNVENAPAFQQALELKKQLVQSMDELFERTNLVEREFQIKDQYERQLYVLEVTGIVETLQNGKKGIRSIAVDGEVREYPVPTLKEVTQRLLDLEIKYGKGFLEKKKSQGFKNVILVPFGMPLRSLIKTLKINFISHYKNRELFHTKINETDLDKEVFSPAYERELSRNVEVKNNAFFNFEIGYLFDGDIQGTLLYDVKNFDPENHGGKTKAQLLNEREMQRKDGWDVLLFEENMVIPKGSNGKSMGVGDNIRKQIEAGKKSTEYFKFLSENIQDPHSPYQGEEGLTPEQGVMLMLSYIEEYHELLDGIGAGCLNLGAYFLEDETFSVPFTRFSLTDGQLNFENIKLDTPGLAFAGIRTAVKA